MPTGTGAVALRNLPNVAYEISPSKFAALTERQEFDPNMSVQLAAPGIAAPDVTLLQVGVVAQLRLITTGAVVSSSTTGTSATYKWPYGIYSNLQLSGNGQNNFQNVNGLTYQIRELIQAKAFIDDVTSAPLTPIAAGAGTAPFTIIHDIPISIDMTSLVGALYAQTEATELTLRLTTSPFSEILVQTTPADLSLTNTAGTANTSPSCAINEVFFEVPYDPTSGNKVLVIPDLSVLHGLIGQRNAIGAQTQGVTALPRQNGQLERLIFWTDDSTTSPTLLTTSKYSYARLTYGSKKSPYDYEVPLQLRAVNNRDYRNALPDGILVLDFIKENPRRDVVLLQGVTNLRLETGYATAPGAGTFVYWVMETLFA